MPDEYILLFHPDFFRDMKALDKREREAVYGQIKKVKKDPLRFKRLHGIENCYRIRIGNLRMIYYVRGKEIWFLTVERRKLVYSMYFKRLYRIKRHLDKK